MRFDGVSLRPLLEGRSASWSDRKLFFPWHRGDVSERGRAFAARSQRYTPVPWQGAGAGVPGRQPPPQLFAMADPLEARDVSTERPAVVDSLRHGYDAWFADVTARRDYSDDGVARIVIGDRREDPVRLTRQDWRGPDAAWTPTGLGQWLVHVRRDGPYTVSLRFVAHAGPGFVTFALGRTRVQRDVRAGSRRPWSSGMSCCRAVRAG